MSNPPPSGIGAKFLLVLAAIVVILAGLKAAQSLISPFLLAIFFAVILTPPLRWIKKKGLPDVLAILVLSAFVFLMGLGVVLVFSNSLTQFAAKLPAYKEKVSVGYTTIDSWINDVADKMRAVGESVQQLNPIDFEYPEIEAEAVAEPETTTTTAMEMEAESTTEPEAETSIGVTIEPTALPGSPALHEKRLSLSNVIPVNTLISYIQLGVNTLLNIATASTLVLIMLIFMLMEVARMPNKVKEAFGGRDLSNEYFKKIAEDTWNYMKIKTIICFLTGSLTSIGLWFLGVEYALLWGLLMFFLNYIPNIGQIIASVPPILLALIDGGLLSATLVTAWLIFVNTVLGVGVEPRFLEHGLGISSLVVLLSLLFWGWLLGPVGMFLSAPLTMVMKIVLQNDPKTRWIAVLLSNR
jgi:predicted PurR-regulated permease PerM